MSAETNVRLNSIIVAMIKNDANYIRVQTLPPYGDVFRVLNAHCSLWPNETKRHNVRCTWIDKLISFGITWGTHVIEFVVTFIRFSASSAPLSTSRHSASALISRVFFINFELSVIRFTDGMTHRTKSINRRTADQFAQKPIDCFYGLFAHTLSFYMNLWWFVIARSHKSLFNRKH